MAHLVFDHLVYVRGFEGCNLVCDHCYIPANPKCMNMDMVARIAEIVSEFASPGSRIALRWHGGEPTMLGVDWLREAIEIVHGQGPEYRWQHSLQTNLMTYSESLSALAKEYFDGELGVSWDYAIRHSRRGGQLSNAQYEYQFWKNFDLLLEDGIRPNLVITVTKLLIDRFSDPFSFLEFLIEHRISTVHLERITPTGKARTNWLEIGINNQQYAQWMRRLFLAYRIMQRTSVDLPVSISPFDNLREAAKLVQEGKQPNEYLGCWSNGCDTKFHTIDANGYKRGCTALTAEIDNPRTATHRIIPIVADASSARIVRQESLGCRQCPYSGFCSSACLAAPAMDESGVCSGARPLMEAIHHSVCAEAQAETNGHLFFNPNHIKRNFNQSEVFNERP